jgi:ceramide glucosyltransferase
MATGAVLVVSDSNVRVTPGYLCSLLRELELPGVGLATSLFVGSGEETLGAALENLQLGSTIAPGIVATNLATPWPATVGKSMAMRRADLARVGGFGRFGSLLAEDQALGWAFAEAGMNIRTTFDAVHNRNTRCTVRRTLERHTRWAKLRRALHPAGFVVEPILSPLVVATIVAAASRSQLAVAVAGSVALLQSAVALGTVAFLRGQPLARRYAPLEIVRAYLVFGCWVAACLSTRIHWRGHALLLKRGSVIAPAPPSVWERVRQAMARA